MKYVSRVSLALLAVSLATPALASFGGGGKSDPPPSTTSSTPSSDPSQAGLSNRQEADRWYKDAYEDIQKAKASLEARKDKDAEKKFRRALERGEKATALDEKYHEAWNLVGYAARKLKDYDRAVASYERCLKLKPDYAPAREYLGEAYVEMGKIDLAKEQLAALDPLKSPEEARTLNTAIEAWEKANGAKAGGETGNGTPTATGAAVTGDKK